jgi:hypothetical protein
MDWEGHFTVPALLVYEILRPREDRRMRRVLVLGCVSLASAAVVFVLHGYFQDLAARSPAILASGGGDLPKFSFASIPKYAADGIQVAFRSADASVAGVESQGASTWFARQGRYLTEMFTWPAALAILAGIVMAFTRLTNGLALGMTLLVPGLLNVLVFRHHASEHEYWTYYLAPGVAVTTAEVVRILLKPRILAVAFLATVAAFSVHRIHQKLGEGREFDFKHLALELDQFLEHENEILICDVRFAPVTFYTRHWVVADMFSGRSWEHVENFRGLKKTGGLPNPVSFLVVPLGADPPLEELSGYGTLRRLDPPEVSARLPSIARQYDGPLWVLRID